MATSTLPAELLFPKARVTRALGNGDTIRHRRVRVVIGGDLVRIYEHDGTLTIEARFVESAYMDGAASFALSTDNGETWNVEKMGCNCGGG